MTAIVLLLCVAGYPAEGPDWAQVATIQADPARKAAEASHYKHFLALVVQDAGIVIPTPTYTCTSTPTPS